MHSQTVQLRLTSGVDVASGSLGGGTGTGAGLGVLPPPTCALFVPHSPAILASAPAIIFTQYGLPSVSS